MSASDWTLPPPPKPVTGAARGALADPGWVRAGLLAVAHAFLGFFLVLPLAFLRESHITVDFLTDRLPARARAVIEALSALLGAALLAAILWNSIGQALIQLRQGDKSQTLGIPMIWYWAPLVVGMALSLLAVLLVGLRALRKL